jgi:tryptophanase
MNLKLSNGRVIPIETHKVRVVQKTTLPPVAQRLKALEEGGYNTFSLRTKDIFIDMLTDSGTNAMSDCQLAAMMVSDDAYAGCETFYKLKDAIKDVLGFEYVLPVHQGRAAEHLLAKVFVKPGDVVPMNYHFTTTKAHFELAGGTVLEIYTDEALNTQSTCLFKGNLDLQKFEDTIRKYGREKVSFVRMEATTNLLGGQPFSLENLREVKRIASENNIPLVLDGSLIAENAYFIKQREEGYEKKSIQEIILEMMSFADIFYLSGRKSSCVRGGFIATNNKKYYEDLKVWLPVYEGFLTYGGMSTKEIEAMAVGLREMTDIDVAGSAPTFVRYFAERMIEKKIPVVTPPGGLACHVDAKLFLPEMPQCQYPAGALAAATYIASGVRTMERGTISMDRDKDGKEVYSDLELVRFAIPRRVYTMSHIEYVVDRVHWLYENRNLVKGLRFIEEPPVLRFFFGRLEPLDNWGRKLAEAFAADFGTDY